MYTMPSVTSVRQITEECLVIHTLWQSKGHVSDIYTDIKVERAQSVVVV